MAGKHVNLSKAPVAPVADPWQDLVTMAYIETVANGSVRFPTFKQVLEQGIKVNKTRYYMAVNTLLDLVGD